MAQPGVSFSPLNAGTPGSGSGSAQSPLQDAIKIISFRMPSVVGAYSPSPLAGNLGDSTADNWLMNLFKGLLPGGESPVPGAPGAPPSPFDVPGQTPSGTGGNTPPPPQWTGAPPPGPPPQAPPPVVVFEPPGIPPVLPPVGPPTPPGPPPPTGPPEWRDWIGPRD